MQNPTEKRIVLGVGGGIAAYKSCELVRLLKDRGYDVRVVMTQNAQEFVTPMTFQALSQNPVHTSLFDLTQESQMGHIHLADSADLICVAPTTANLLAKFAHGSCDDLLTTLVCASRAPKLLAPAMNVHMWENVLTQKNIAAVKAAGFHVLDPACGALACGYDGKGRLPDPASIVTEIESILSIKSLLKGKRVLVTAGPTREFLDPFRFLSNPSSGKMGIAFAQAAQAMGAQVELLLGPTQLTVPSGMAVTRFVSAQDLLSLCQARADTVDVLIMAAAVSDYTFGAMHSSKLKKEAKSLSLALSPTVDILKTLGERPTRPFLVGFAAETDQLEAYAIQKLAEKNCDVILANRIGDGAGFESDDNTLLGFFRNGVHNTWGPLPKRRLAEVVLEAVAGVIG